ncbi:MAG: TetR/AcrR family transcriptional regulator [Myxococcota bacterium]
MGRKRDEAAFEAKRAEIREVAEALFAERGFHQTGMAAICAELGMSPGALYRYYASKAEIIHAIVEQERVESIPYVEQLASAKDFTGALVSLLSAFIAEVMDDDYAGLALEISAEAHRDDDIGTLLRDSEETLVRALATQIAAASKDGRVGSQADPDASARMLLTLVNGAVGDGAGLARLSKRRTNKALRAVVESLMGRS